MNWRERKDWPYIAAAGGFVLGFIAAGVLRSIGG